MSRKSKKRGYRRLSANTVRSLEQVERAVERASSQQPRLTGKSATNAFFNSVIGWTTDARDQEPPYVADSRVRDMWLADFWRKEPHLAGVLSSVNSIDANRGWHLTGGRNQVNRFTDILRYAEDGAGWRQYISLQSTAYYTSDIGALTETGRDGTDGPLRALYHLDSTKCCLTGDRRAPLRYDKTKDPWTDDDFFRLVSMRNIREEYYGLGFCAVSRVLDMSKIMLAVYNHELESLGAKAPKGLLLLQNIGEGQWQEAMKARDAAMDSDMRKYYAAVAVIAQQGFDSIDAKLVALSQLPAGFDIEVFTNLLMYAYALCFGYDPIEFWPVLAGQLGRGRETDIQHRKGTGKGGMNFMLAFQDQLQQQLPNTLDFQFEQRDQEGILLEAEVAQAWANVAATLYTGGSSEDPGPAGAKGGDGEGAAMPASPSAPAEKPESQPTPAAATKQQTGSILTLEEVRSFLAMQGVIPAAWTTMTEDVTSTDYKDAEQRRRDELLSNDSVRRAVYQFPHEPIVRYSWPSGKAEVLFRSGADALKATRYTVVKPELLLPTLEEETVPETAPLALPEPATMSIPMQTQRLKDKFNIYRGDTVPFKVRIKDTKGGEFRQLPQAQYVNYYIMDLQGKVLLQKERGHGVTIEDSLVVVDFEPEDTRKLQGIYRHCVKVIDDIGRTFTGYSDLMCVLGEVIDAE